MSKLLNDEQFKHVSYHHTDVAETFKRVRKEQAAAKVKREAEEAAAKAEQEATAQEALRKVRTIKGAK